MRVLSESPSLLGISLGHAATPPCPTAQQGVAADKARRCRLAGWRNAAATVLPSTSEAGLAAEPPLRWAARMTHTVSKLPLTSTAGSQARRVREFWCALLSMLSLPCLAHAHGQEGLALIVGPVYSFPLFLVVVVAVGARMRTRLWCIAAYVGGVPLTWSGLAPFLTRENANLVAVLGGVVPFGLGLVPWLRARRAGRTE